MRILQKTSGNDTIEAFGKFSFSNNSNIIGGCKMEISDIQKEVLSLADKTTDFSDFSLALNPRASKIIGVRLPILRKIAKKIAKDDYKKFLAENPMDCYEMEILQGMVIGYAKDDLDEILKWAAIFIPKIHDWSVNDTFCQTFKIAKKKQSECWNFILQYKNSQKEFEVRVVAVMLLCHFLNDEYICEVFKVIDGLYTGSSADKNDFYYAKMGLAWALSEAAVKYPRLCLSYMKGKNNLDKWTFNKAIQKMKESYCVNENLKKEMQTLKK